MHVSCGQYRVQHAVAIFVPAPDHGRSETMNPTFTISIITIINVQLFALVLMSLIAAAHVLIGEIWAASYLGERLVLVAAALHIPCYNAESKTWPSVSAIVR